MATLKNISVKFVGSQPTVTINNDPEDFSDDLERYGQTGNILVTGVRGTQLPEDKVTAIIDNIQARWGELQYHPTKGWNLVQAEVYEIARKS